MRRLINFSLSFFTVTLAVYVLSAASSFFVPLIIAFVISYLMIAIIDGVNKIHIGSWKVPKIFGYFISLLGFVVFFYFLYILFENNISTLAEAAPMYQERLNDLYVQIFEKFNIKPPSTDLFEKLDFTSFLRQAVLMLTEVAGNAGMILVYILFILIEYGFYDSKLHALFKNTQSKKSAENVINKISSQVKSYIRIKTLLSILTALCSYTILILVGVDFPEFWALLIFVLNFIPSIGSIVATIFPSLMTLLQFETFAPFIIVTGSLVIIQFTIGNIIEPRIMGKHFNLSGLVIILSLVIWGQIWGLIGMLICVPLLMIMNIIFANFPQTRPIAILLSQNGEIE